MCSSDLPRSPNSAVLAEISAGAPRRNPAHWVRPGGAVEGKARVGQRYRRDNAFSPPFPTPTRLFLLPVSPSATTSPCAAAHKQLAQPLGTPPSSPTTPPAPSTPLRRDLASGEILGRNASTPPARCSAFCPSHGLRRRGDARRALRRGRSGRHRRRRTPADLELPGRLARPRRRAAVCWIEARSPQEQAEAAVRGGTASSTPTTSPRIPPTTRRCSGAVS